MSSCPVHTCPHTIVDTYHKRHRNVRTSLSLPFFGDANQTATLVFSLPCLSHVYFSICIPSPPPRPKKNQHSLFSECPRTSPSGPSVPNAPLHDSVGSVASSSAISFFLLSLLLTPQAQVKPKPKSTSTLSLSPRFVLQSEVSFWFDREIGKAEKTGFAPSI